ELWVSSDDGRLHLTKDGGGNWTELSDNLQGMPAGAWIPQIVHSKHKEGAAFVVANDYRRGDERPMLFYTENYGKSFKNIGASLPAYVISVVQDIENPNLIFAGTQRGLFFSWDMGAHWQKWSKDFPTVLVSDLKIHPREHDLIVGTFGRAAYILDNLEELRASINLAQSSSAQKLKLYPPSPALKYASKRADGSRFPADGIFKGENRGFGLKAFVYNGFEASDSVKTKKVKAQILNEEGNTLRTLYLDPKKGLNAYRIGLSQKGLGFPSKGRKLSDTTEQAPIPLDLGKYHLRMIYGGDTTIQSFEYQLDPRLKGEMNLKIMSAQVEYRKRVDASLDSINEAAIWIKTAKAKIAISKDIATLQVDPHQAKAYSDSLKDLTKALTKFEERLYGKEVDGYYDQPNTLQSQYYSIYTYIGRNFEIVPIQAQILQRKYYESEKEFLKDLKKFIADDWTKFESLQKQFDLNLQD
ncbi:MAG: WD40/YVTN/BNR-like repeat-containing protein, partial [Croceimicrobium sp.]